MRRWIAQTGSSYAATAHLVAGIEVGGSFDEAPDRAFRPLAGFIDGANRSRRQIAMTAPVTQQKASPEKIAMTAPVVQQTAGRPGATWCSLRCHRTSHPTLPAPDDARVPTRAIPQKLRQRCGSPAGGHVTGSRPRGPALRRAGAARRHHRQRRVPGFVPATAAASTSGAMRWLMAHVLPRMPFATSGRCGRGLVRVHGLSTSVTCLSSSPAETAGLCPRPGPCSQPL